jgi:hypothetical protein
MSLGDYKRQLVASLALALTPRASGTAATGEVASPTTIRQNYSKRREAVSGPQPSPLPDDVPSR